MPEDPNDVFPTLRELKQSGFIPLDTSSKYDAWYYVARFIGDSIRDQVNLRVMLASFEHAAKRRHPNLDEPLAVVARQDLGDVDIDHVFLHPDADLQVLAFEMNELIHNEGHLNEEAFWSVMSPHIQSIWDKTDIPDRMKLCEDCPEQVLDVEVPFEAHTAIYRDLDD